MKGTTDEKSAGGKSPEASQGRQDERKPRRHKAGTHPH